MSVNSKMTAIADEIRILSGAKGTMGLDAMATNISNVNDEIAAQAELINQIASALEGKVSGGSGSTSVNTCTVTLNCFNDISSLSYSAFENGAIVVKYINTYSQSYVLENIICGSAITFLNFNEFNGFTHTHDSKYIGHHAAYMWVVSAPTTAGVNATITIFDDD